MANPAIKIPTYADILLLPENIIGEIINGCLYTQPRPAPKHTLAASSLADELISPFQKKRGGPGGWWIFIEPELHISQHILVPDLSGWRKQKMPRLPDTAWFEITPDWVCEILSPSTAKIDRTDKMQVYANLGVNFCWLIDPVLQTLECYKLYQGHWLLKHNYKDSDLVRAQPFAEYDFNLSHLWEN